MSTINAIPDTETGSITLDVLTTDSVTKIVRVNANGTEEVRTAEGQLPSTVTATAVRTNLVTNPSFETGTATYSLATAEPAAISNPTTGGYFGSRTGRVTTTGEFPLNTYFGLKFQSNLVGGKTYVVSYHGKVGPGVHPTMIIQIIDTNTGNFVSSTKTTEYIEAWEGSRFGARFTVPGTTTRTMEFRLLTYVYSNGINSVTPIGSYIDFDGVSLEEAFAVPSYFDGNTPDESGIDYAWTGTAHASTSVINTIGGRLILTDYEAAHGANTYNVYHDDGSFVTATASLELDKPWLSVPVMPQYSETVESITSFGANRDSATTIHRPLGRTDSLVVMGKLGTRTGSMEIFCRSYADARKLERIFERGEIVQLRQRVEGMDMYFTVTSIPVSPFSVQGEDETRWAMNINYVEVRRPIGELAGALGWTFDALAADFTSFDEVTQVFVDFDALTLGDANV